MPTSPNRQFYVVPIRVVHVGTIALIISLFMNGLGTIFYARLAAPDNGAQFFSDKRTPALLPVDVRPVALEVLDSNRYGMHDDNDWASVTPLGHGFVKIGEGEENFYAISMYHQLHCLNSFRRQLNAPHNATLSQHDAMHSIHCLSYLRQMFLCSADLALEPAVFVSNTNGGNSPVAYGAGVWHQCKDWENIRSFAEGNYETWKDEAEGFAASEISAKNA